MGYAKHKDGDVISLYWDCGTEALYVKGHIDPVEAEKILRAEYGDEFNFETPIPAYARWSMEYRSFDSEPGLVLRDCEGPGRGRFKVMWARVI